MPEGMLTLILVSAIFIAVAILVAIANYRFNKWLDQQARYGCMGIIYAGFVIFVVSCFVGIILFWAVVVVLSMFAGSLVGLLFAVPIYLGLPTWTLIPYGAILGLLCFVCFTYFRRKLQNKTTTSVQAA